MFSFFTSGKPLLNEAQQSQLLQAIRLAEQRTSGEIRIFLEKRCRYVDAADRAAEIFFEQGMQQTAQRNAVLIYLATQDHQLAIWADQGIYEKLGAPYWGHKVQEMAGLFKKEDYLQGLVNCIEAIGDALHQHFPYDRNQDRNELSDEILFGK
ncbi:MAG: TPM domain-containing protein [Sphingomonadales bacterium]|nr:TPM domain-containing protein [Sphingomonadales bacterium]